MQFKVGKRVQVSTYVDYAPYAIIPPGALGTVVTVGQTLGEYSIEIEWDDYIKGLAEWHNRTLLVAGELDAVVPIIRRLAVVADEPRSDGLLRLSG